jgi:hypothetical protein
LIHGEGSDLSIVYLFMFLPSHPSACLEDGKGVGAGKGYGKAGPCHVERVFLIVSANFWQGVMSTVRLANFLT